LSVGRLIGGRVPLLVSISLALFATAWVMANPPSAAPDEADHYVKAIAAGGGDLRGRPPNRSYAAFTARRIASARAKGDPSQIRTARWQFRTARTYIIPAWLTYSAFGCAHDQSHRSWECVDRSHTPPAGAGTPTAFVGTYQPFLYVPPGLAMRNGDDAHSALTIGRAITAGISLLLLIGAAILLWSPAAGLVSLTGFMVAVTPMVLFLASALSASGPEVAASVCFAAALIRLSRDSRLGRWVWLGVAAGGSILGASRQLGPVFVAAIALAVTALVGPRLLLARFRGGVAPIAAVITVVVGCGAALIWELFYGRRVQQGLGEVVEAVPFGVERLTAVIRQAVGYFGQVDAPMPGPAYLTWILLLGALVGAALAVGSWRDRVGLVLLVAGVLGAVVVIAALHRQTGFTLHARHVLGLLVLVPLWAGELLCRRAERVEDARLSVLALGVALVVPFLQAAAWYSNGRRVAVGVDGSWLFPLDPEWEPSGGWMPWLALVAVATGIYLLAGISAVRGLNLHLRRFPLRLAGATQSD
jgi:hypothetical protein